MRKIYFFINTVILLLLLSGCREWEQDNPYLYYMLNANNLQTAYNKCVQEVADSALPCDIIMRAQADFTLLSNQREADPEKFGAEVMQAEENAVYLKSQFDKTVQAYQELGKTNPKLEVMKAKRVELDNVQKAYKQSSEKVQILLSVIAATSNV